MLSWYRSTCRRSNPRPLYARHCDSASTLWRWTLYAFKLPITEKRGRVVFLFTNRSISIMNMQERGSHSIIFKTASPCILKVIFWVYDSRSKLNIVLGKKLVRCYVWSIALYDSETWTLRKLEWKYLESFEMWCWRRMEKITWARTRSWTYRREEETSKSYPT